MQTPEDEPAGSIHMHYMFFESERSPATDPVLLWSNGGPGAGSEFGMFTELGPLMLSEESLKTDLYKATGVPTLWRNENAWTKVANVLIYDSPAPVSRPSSALLYASLSLCAFETLCSM